MKTFFSIALSLSTCFCIAQQRKATVSVTQTAFGSFGKSMPQSGKVIEPLPAQKKTADGGKATMVKFNSKKPKVPKEEKKKINEEALVFSVYPNPAHSEINIKVIGIAPNDKYIVRIKNLVGQNIFEQPFNDKQLKINVSAFPRGFFLVNVCDEKGTKCHTQKLMIQ